MFVIHMSDTEYVIVKYNSDKEPVAYLQSIVVRLDADGTGLAFACDINSAYSFNNFETAIAVLRRVVDLLGDDYCENLTIGRVYRPYGEVELICIYV